MKRCMWLFAVLLAITSCHSQPSQYSQPASVEAAPEPDVEAQTKTLTVADIKQALAHEKDTVISAIVPKSKIAVLDIDSYDQDLGVFATEEIIMFLVKARKFSVVDRDSIETLLKEQHFQTSGVVSDSTAVSIGKFIGASVIITGAIYQRYGQIDFSLKILDVETAEIIDLISVPIWEL